MFIISNYLIKNNVYSIIFSIILYILLYLYFLIYNEGLYPVFIKFIPYFITIDLVITGFLTYFNDDNVEENYIDMDEVKNTVDKDIQSQVYNSTEALEYRTVHDSTVQSSTV